MVRGLLQSCFGKREGPSFKRLKAQTPGEVTFDLKKTTEAILVSTVLPSHICDLLAMMSGDAAQTWSSEACNPFLEISEDQRMVKKRDGTAAREYQTVRVADFVAEGDSYSNVYTWCLQFGQADGGNDRWFKSFGVVTEAFCDWTQPVGRDTAGNSWAVNAYNGFRYYQDKSATFSEPMNCGQLIRLTVDFNRKELMLRVDDRDYGVVYRGIGDKVALACTLYNSGDWVQLVE